MKNLILAVLAIVSSSPSQAIVNGAVPPKGSTIERHTVMLRIGKGLCSGTILSPDMVLTAAHCMEGAENGITVRFGVRGEQASRPGIAWRSHPAYRQFDNDVALVRFSGGLPAGYSPAPALDDSPANIPAGFRIISAGYGDTGPRNGNVGLLRFAEFRVVATRGPQVVLHGNGTSTCFGDSGGPAFLEHEGELVLFGVVSGAIQTVGGCDGSMLFGRLDSHASWIERAIRELRGAR